MGTVSRLTALPRVAFQSTTHYIGLSRSLIGLRSVTPVLRSIVRAQTPIIFPRSLCQTAMRWSAQPTDDSKTEKKPLKETMQEASKAHSETQNVAVGQSKHGVKALLNVLREYGILAAVYHQTVYVCTFATFYVAIKSGLDVKALVDSLPESLQAEWLHKGAQTAGSVGLAFILQKLISPLR